MSKIHLIFLVRKKKLKDTENIFCELATFIAIGVNLKFKSWIAPRIFKYTQAFDLVDFENTSFPIYSLQLKVIDLFKWTFQSNNQSSMKPAAICSNHFQKY